MDEELSDVILKLFINYSRHISIEGNALIY